MTDVDPTADDLSPEDDLFGLTPDGAAESAPAPVAEESAAEAPEPAAAEARVVDVAEDGAAVSEDGAAIAEDDMADAEDDDEDDAAPPPISPYDRPGRWYVVHTYAGYENKVKSNLENRIVSMNMEDRIYEVVIPLEDVVEFKNGKRQTVQKKVLPGYLLVRCDLDDDSWFVVRNTPGVTGFVGAKPIPLSRKEVEDILHVPLPGEDAPKKTKPRVEFEAGESVRVREGPFADFTGAIAEINEDKLELTVLVNIFGRETPVKLEFSQVTKL